MNEKTTRISNMVSYVLGLHHQKSTVELYTKYEADIQQITPEDLFEVFHVLLQQGIKASEVLVFLDKVTNVTYQSLSQREWQRPAPESFFGVLVQENAGLVSKLSELSKLLLQKNVVEKKEELLLVMMELSQFHAHYLKKENILFPMMEKKSELYDGLRIMWSLHDEIRSMWKRVILLLDSKNATENALHVEIGSLFFVMRGLVVKEEMILFPTASALFDAQECQEMYEQCFEYEFCFMEPPMLACLQEESTEKKKEALLFQSPTGSITFEQLTLILGALPVDLSFVDEENKLRFFTRPQDRIFPRSPASLGRDVKQCHPEKSVDVVIEIIDAFRTGQQDTASFWLELKGKMILIQYFALRSASGDYKGCLEVSQDVTSIRALEGQRRLVQWGK